jgi:hypothetical protein
MTPFSSTPSRQQLIADQNQRCREASLRAASLRQQSDIACSLLRQACARLQLVYVTLGT